MALYFRDSQSGVPKLFRFGLPGLWAFITSRSDLRLGWGLKQSCSSLQELSNGVLHFTCTHQNRVNSRLLMVGSQTAILTTSLSFDHNSCCKCPNGSCKAILDIYTSRAFQQYKKHFNARCLDPSNRALNFQESRRTPKTHFQECEWQPHTSFKVGLQQVSLTMVALLTIFEINFVKMWQSLETYIFFLFGEEYQEFCWWAQMQ